MQIIRAEEGPPVAAAAELLREYMVTLGLSACGQREFDEELTAFPGPYAPPTGSLLLALDGEDAAGCVAIKDSGAPACELKRLYVKPHARGRGLGRTLTVEAISEARNLGYRVIRLDTIPEMAEAISLYRSLGFRPAAPFRSSPAAGALYFELELDPA